VKPGKGKITDQRQAGAKYFARPVLRMLITSPSWWPTATSSSTCSCTVVGGGLSGQAGAVRHGISKALTNYEPSCAAS
jgi:small subunit ribosomal protein S9